MIGVIPDRVVSPVRRGARAQLAVFLAAYLVYDAARWIFSGDLDDARRIAGCAPLVFSPDGCTGTPAASTTTPTTPAASTTTRAPGG